MTTLSGFSIASGKSRAGDSMLLRNQDLVSIKVSGSDTEGRIAIIESMVSAGAGPVLHLHHGQNEWWYVLEGEFLFQVGNQKFRAQLGSSVFGPRGIPHAFRCVGKAPGKILMTFDPAGQIERLFEELVKMGSNAGAGRHNEKDILQECGLEFVGPPLSDT